MRRWGLVLAALMLSLSVFTSCTGPTAQEQQPSHPAASSQSTPLPSPSGAESTPVAEAQEQELSVTLTANGQEFEAVIYDNPSARAFIQLLPLSAEMEELNGNEKYYYFEDPLPADSQAMQSIQAGDLMLYGDDCFVLFYEDFETPYSYTPLGKIQNPEGLKEALGTGNIQVALTQ